MLSGIYTYLDKKVSGIVQTDELLRAEWVARVSAMDLYFHELIAQCISEVFVGSRPTTAAFEKFQISSVIMQRIRRAANPTEASAAFDLYVREQLGRVTYQLPDDIADGIRLVSAVELWNEVALALGASPANKSKEAKDLKLKHSLIMRRRNAIAHEGDLMLSSLREPSPISSDDVVEAAKHIEQIVRTIDGLICKPRSHFINI